MIFIFTIIILKCSVRDMFINIYENKHKETTNNITIYDIINMNFSIIIYVRFSMIIFSIMINIIFNYFYRDRGLI